MAASAACKPIDDKRGTIAYRVKVAGVLARRAAQIAVERARARYATVLGEARPMIIGRMLRSRGTRRFYQVRLPAESRAGAEALCARIQSVGGVCVALRS